MSQFLCLCGCGRPTAIATHTTKRTGAVLGQPLQFIKGHNARGKNSHFWTGGVRTANGYRFVRTETGDYVQEHSLVAATALGKPLPLKSVVHHVDEVKHNNHNSNLVICQDEAYHQYLHRRMRALKECGNADWLLCLICGRHDAPENLETVIRNHGRHLRAWHKECRSSQRRELYLRERKNQ